MLGKQADLKKDALMEVEQLQLQLARSNAEVTDLREAAVVKNEELRQISEQAAASKKVADNAVGRAKRAEEDLAAQRAAAEAEDVVSQQQQAIVATALETAKLTRLLAESEAVVTELRGSTAIHDKEVVRISEQTAASKKVAEEAVERAKRAELDLAEERAAAKANLVAQRREATEIRQRLTLLEQRHLAAVKEEKDKTSALERRLEEVDDDLTAAIARAEAADDRAGVAESRATAAELSATKANSRLTTTDRSLPVPEPSCVFDHATRVLLSAARCSEGLNMAGRSCDPMSVAVTDNVTDFRIRMRDSLATAIKRITEGESRVAELQADNDRLRELVAGTEIGRDALTSSQGKRQDKEEEEEEEEGEEDVVVRNDAVWTDAFSTDETPRQGTQLELAYRRISAAERERREADAVLAEVVATDAEKQGLGEGSDAVEDRQGTEGMQERLSPSIDAKAQWSQRQRWRASDVSAATGLVSRVSDTAEERWGTTVVEGNGSMVSLGRRVSILEEWRDTTEGRLGGTNRLSRIDEGGLHRSGVGSKAATRVLADGRGRSTHATDRALLPESGGRPSGRASLSTVR